VHGVAAQLSELEVAGAAEMALQLFLTATTASSEVAGLELITYEFFEQVPPPPPHPPYLPPTHLHRHTLPSGLLLIHTPDTHVDPHLPATEGFNLTFLHLRYSVQNPNLRYSVQNPKLWKGWQRR
jgi:hypothetical protein